MDPTLHFFSWQAQNQALHAILFLYRNVLKIDLPWLDEVQRAKKPQHLPVVFTREEVKALLAQLQGTTWLMAMLTYGSGLRLLECLRLRVKDVDFHYRQLLVRDAKGQKDRVTMLPNSLVDPMRTHLARVRYLHEIDLRDGYGRVHLPYALANKYPNADREWGWQHVFPSSRRSIDPRSGSERRHHAPEDALQRAVKQAIRKANIVKPGSVHNRPLDEKIARSPHVRERLLERRQILVVRNFDVGAGHDCEITRSALAQPWEILRETRPSPQRSAR